MKKILAISLLVSFTLSITGIYPVFVTLQLHIRKEIKMRIKQGVPESEIQKIVFAPDEKINWVREGKEFRLNDQMFDIVSSEDVNGEVVFNCINDKQEEELFANLDALVKKQLDDDGSAKGSALRFLVKMFSQTCILEELFRLMENRTEKVCFSELCFRTETAFIEAEAPPPDFISY